MARKKPVEEPENHERWLVSYADFITLLFAFFVVMYSTSSVNEGKMRVLSDSLVASFAGRTKSLEPIQVGKLVRSPYTDDSSPTTSPNQFVIVASPDARSTLKQDRRNDALRKGEGFLGDVQGEARSSDNSEVAPGQLAFGGDGGKGEGLGKVEENPYSVPDRPLIGGAGNTAPNADAPVQQQDMADIVEVTDTIRESMSPLIDAREVALAVKNSWLEIQLDSSKLFVSGSARIATMAVPTLRQLADVLKQFPNPIQVEGFTDNVPIRTLSFPSNWELSAARAASVVHLFTKEGIHPARMVAIGYGEHRPIGDNATPEGRAKNRRVVVVVPADRELRRILQDGDQVDVKPGGTS